MEKTTTFRAPQSLELLKKIDFLQILERQFRCTLADEQCVVNKKHLYFYRMWLQTDLFFVLISGASFRCVVVVLIHRQC